MLLTQRANKRIFISDIHMGDVRSMNRNARPLYPFGWLRDNIGKLTNFLHDQLYDEDVGQVVILGDLFDQWVIPTDFDPLPRLDGICNNLANEGIINNFKGLAADSRLFYVPGNHDMSVCPKDIGVTKEFIEMVFPGIHFICDDDQPTGVYREEQLVAEHGNMYCLFNAPDTWTNRGNSFLPLGYFISRLVAYKVAQTGLPENIWNIYRNFIDESKQNPNFIYDIFLATAEDAGLNKSDKTNMGNIGDFGLAITIDEIANKYIHLKQQWDENAHKIGSGIAILADSPLDFPLGLTNVAYKVYYGPALTPISKLPFLDTLIPGRMKIPMLRSREAMKRMTPL